MKAESESSHSSGFPLISPPAPPLLDEEDYPHTRFWTMQEWQRFLNDQMDYGKSIGKLGFICDEDGNTVSKDRIKKMTETAKRLWSDLYRHRYDPDTWRCVTMRADEYYTNNMRIAFPELSLCADNWKVQALATIRYPDWTNGLRSTGRLTRTQFSMIISYIFRVFFLGQVPSVNTNTSGQSGKPRSGKKRERDQETESKKFKPNKHLRVDQDIVDLTSSNLASDSSASLILPSSSLVIAAQPTPATLAAAPCVVATITTPAATVSGVPFIVATSTTPATPAVLSMDIAASAIGPIVASPALPLVTNSIVPSIPAVPPIAPATALTVTASSLVPVAVEPSVAATNTPIASIVPSVATPSVTAVSASVTPLPDIQLDGIVTDPNPPLPNATRKRKASLLT